MAENFLQEDAVNELKRSRGIVGELSPVVWDDRRDEVVSGAHRLKAGWKNVKHIWTKDDVEFFRLKVNYTVQRQMPPIERASMLEAFALALEKAGKTNREIIDELIAASPLHPSNTYAYIPDHYKSKEGRPRKGEFSQGETNLPEDSLESRPRLDSDESEPVRIGKCSNCGFEGKWNGTGLVQLTFTDHVQTTRS